MSGLSAIQEDLQRTLDRALAEQGVPGAAVGIQLSHETLVLSGGVANLRTQTPVTPDTLFLIGSISKVYTATLTLMLAERGLIELDAGVRHYLPELRLGDAVALDAMTVRQLICHTSGIDENLGLDFGRDEDCIARFVARGVELPQLHPPGAMFSYCNSGFIIAGRIIEKVTGRSFDQAVRDLLAQPLALQNTVMLAEDAILHPVAVGHLASSPAGDIDVTPVWTLPRAVGPAGGICTSVGDVLRFAELHFDSSSKGEPYLSAASLSAMQEPQVALPDKRRGNAQGLGWRLWDVAGETILGHFGGNIGQYCHLMVIPARSFAMAMVTNSFAGAPVHECVRTWVFEDILDLDPRMPPEEVGHVPTDLELFVGTYESYHDTVHVEIRKNGLWMSSTPAPNWINKLYSAEKVSGPLAAVAPWTFEAAGTSLYGEEGSRVVFIALDGGSRPDYLHQGDYAYRRVP